MMSGFTLAWAQRVLHDGRELAVGDQDLGVGVVELEGDDRRVETGVQRMEHRARHRHAVVGFEHRRAYWPA